MTEHADSSTDVVVRWRFQSDSETRTQQLGEALTDVLEPGTVVALSGNLGTGKTHLVRAVAVAAGVDRRDVRSPTFSLIHEYAGCWPIYHFDTYRLGSPEEFLELGSEEYLASGGVCFIEWADRVACLLPADRLEIEISVTGESAREFAFTSTGPRSAGILNRLAARCGR